MEIIFEGIVEILKFVLWYLLWCLMLFNFGRIFLLLATFGKYPRGVQTENDVNFISSVGLGVLFAIWSSIAIYNNWGNLVGMAV
ncbi:MAG: hypothetical protein EPN21_10315 [Methylococcaceae bacterium]|nr:MAG: hypothetical protein EPN21_10315 [Methylococcaceae bacterium]